MSEIESLVERRVTSCREEVLTVKRIGNLVSEDMAAVLVAVFGLGLEGRTWLGAVLDCSRLDYISMEGRHSTSKQVLTSFTLL